MMTCLHSVGIGTLQDWFNVNKMTVLPSPYVPRHKTEYTHAMKMVGHGCWRGRSEGAYLRWWHLSTDRKPALGILG